VRSVLEQLEAGTEAEDLPVALAWLAGQEVPADEDELRAALRRAELLLAAGGDPRRPLEPDGRAVGALAADLDAPGAREALARALEALLPQAKGLLRVEEALRTLLGEEELAWRLYASAILLDSLAED